MSQILNRSNYSPKTIETYEIMSAYYVDIFYNHLYNEAKKMRANNTVASVTEGYKHTLNAFLKSLNNPKLYKQSITGMHHYFINIGFTGISFSSYIDRISKEFIPVDYFSSLTITKKMGVIRKVLNQSIKNFIIKIVNDHLCKIIDLHNEVDNIRLLQDDLIDCFILEREGLFQLFITNQSQTPSSDLVNRLVVDKMQNELKRLVKEKYEQNKLIISLKKLCINQKNDNNNKDKLITDLQTKLSNYDSESQIEDNVFSKIIKKNKLQEKSEENKLQEFAKKNKLQEKSEENKLQESETVEENIQKEPETNEENIQKEPEPSEVYKNEYSTIMDEPTSTDIFSDFI